MTVGAPLACVAAAYAAYATDAADETEHRTRLAGSSHVLPSRVLTPPPAAAMSELAEAQDRAETAEGLAAALQEQLDAMEEALRKPAKSL